MIFSGGAERKQSAPRTPAPQAARAWRALLLLGLALAAVIILFTQEILFDGGPLRRLELSTIDARFSYRGPLEIHPESLDVIIIEISQRSFDILPDRYPWPRSYFAHLVRNLRRAGARAVGFDVIFDQASETDSAGDAEFRRSIRESGFVALAGKTEIRTDRYAIMEKNYGNVFFDADSSIGIAYVPNDPEGVYRRYQPLAYDRSNERLLPTLSFAVLNKAFGKSQFFTVENTPAAFLYGDIAIPKADETSVLINYYGPDGTYRHIPLADVLDDSTFTTKDEAMAGEPINMFDDPDFGYLSMGTFRDKIVLLGSTMPEEKDLFPVPAARGARAGDNLMYGVEIHANMIQNVLDRNFLRAEPRWLDAFAVLFFSLLTLFITAQLKSIKFRFHATGEILGALAAAAVIAVIAAASVYLFVAHNYVTVMTSPVLAVLVSYGGGVVYNYLLERKQKTMIKNMFTQYMNPAVVNELVNNPEKLRLGGERRVLTVFFSDIAGFTSLSEKLPPEALVLVLNEYLSAMTEIIFRHEGTLDKFEGDAVMAFWGAPIAQEDHALRACRASLAMQEELVRMRARWKNEGKPDLHVRIGLNTGEMLVGNMGGVQRFDYTVIGDSVNLASRLEGANKQYHTSIMIGETTHAQVKDRVIARELDKLIVVGKTAPVTVYELIGFRDGALPEAQERFLAAYCMGLELYRRREWASAIGCFEEALKITPGDHPSKMYIERSRLYQMAPPPEEWNGAFTLKSK